MIPKANMAEQDERLQQFLKAAKGFGERPTSRPPGGPVVPEPAPPAEPAPAPPPETGKDKELPDWVKEILERQEAGIELKLVPDWKKRTKALSQVPVDQEIPKDRVSELANRPLELPLTVLREDLMAALEEQGLVGAREVSNFKGTYHFDSTYGDVIVRQETMSQTDTIARYINPSGWVPAVKGDRYYLGRLYSEKNYMLFLGGICLRDDGIKQKGGKKTLLLMPVGLKEAEEVVPVVQEPLAEPAPPKQVLPVELPPELPLTKPEEGQVSQTQEAETAPVPEKKGEKLKLVSGWRERMKALSLIPRNETIEESEVVELADGHIRIVIGSKEENFADLLKSWGLGGIDMKAKIRRRGDDMVFYPSEEEPLTIRTVAFIKDKEMQWGWGRATSYSGGYNLVRDLNDRDRLLSVGSACFKTGGIKIVIEDGKEKIQLSLMPVGLKQEVEVKPQSEQPPLPETTSSTKESLESEVTGVEPVPAPISPEPAPAPPLETGEKPAQIAPETKKIPVVKERDLKASDLLLNSIFCKKEDGRMEETPLIALASSISDEWKREVGIYPDATYREGNEIYLHELLTPEEALYFLDESLKRHKQKEQELSEFRRYWDDLIKANESDESVDIGAGLKERYGDEYGNLMIQSKRSESQIDSVAEAISYITKKPKADVLAGNYEVPEEPKIDDDFINSRLKLVGGVRKLSDSQILNNLLVETRRQLDETEGRLRRKVGSNEPPLSPEPAPPPEQPTEEEDLTQLTDKGLEEIIKEVNKRYGHLSDEELDQKIEELQRLSSLPAYNLKTEEEYCSLSLERLLRLRAKGPLPDYYQKRIDSLVDSYQEEINSLRKGKEVPQAQEAESVPAPEQPTEEEDLTQLTSEELNNKCKEAKERYYLAGDSLKEDIFIKAQEKYISLLLEQLRRLGVERSDIDSYQEMFTRFRKLGFTSSIIFSIFDLERKLNSLRKGKGVAQ